MSRRRKRPRVRRLAQPESVGHCVPGCGRCCNPVVLPFARIDVQLRGENLGPEDRRWVLEDLTPMSRRDAKDLAWYQFSRPTLGVVNGRPVPGPAYYFRCRNLDPVTKACGIYDHRPPACEGYPWYGGEPHPDMAIPPECGYNLDVGREPVPVTLTRKP